MQVYKAQDNGKLSKDAGKINSLDR